MSTVIEHGVVVPKPTVKAVACCTESSRAQSQSCVYSSIGSSNENTWLSEKMLVYVVASPPGLRIYRERKKKL